MQNFDQYLHHFSYLGIFLWFAFGDQLTPIPEEVVMISIGYLCGHTELNPLLAGLAAVAGLMCIDNLFFYLSAKGSKFLDKQKKRFRTTLMQKVEARMHRNAFGTLMIMLFIPKLRFFAPIAGAMMGVKHPAFLLADFVAVSIYVAFYLMLGLFFHNQLENIFKTVENLQHGVFIVGMFALAVVILFSVRRHIGDHKSWSRR